MTEIIINVAVGAVTLGITVVISFLIYSVARKRFNIIDSFPEFYVVGMLLFILGFIVLGVLGGFVRHVIINRG